jgi:hypothetical protein
MTLEYVGLDEPHSTSVISKWTWPTVMYRDDHQSYNKNKLVSVADLLYLQYSQSKYGSSGRVKPWIDESDDSSFELSSNSSIHGLPSQKTQCRLKVSQM